MTGDTVLVQVEGLYRYYGGHCAVHDLNFQVPRGEILGFLGPNGAGKSTTMQMLSGNLAPSAGRIRIDGIDILDNPRAAKTRIGYLPEQPPVYPELTVDEYLTYCARLNRVPRGELADARAEAKRRCGLADTGHRLIGNLSKGYQQRVGIAQAIIHNPALVILDEPTVGLDPIQIREIRSLIAELGREHSVILSSHILPEVQAICSSVQVIHQGRLVYSGRMSELNARGGDRLVVGAARLPDREALGRIAGVQAVEILDPQHARLSHDGREDFAAQVATLAVEEHWGLTELRPEERTLEQVFVDLTTGDIPEEAA